MAIYESGEMYLETIYTLSNSLDRVRSIDIVREMNFSKPSVSNAMKHLKEDGYISIDENGYISLTAKGQEIAEAIYEKHTILTKLFLSFGVNESTAVEDACRIEHIISNESFDAIKSYLSASMNEEKKR